MNMQQLFDDFTNNKIDKVTYIDLMHQKHQILFEYLEYIKNTGIESISIDQNNVCFVAKKYEIKLLVDPHDKRFIPIEIFNFKATEAMENELIMQLVLHCRVIVDVGANIGWYTLNFGKISNIDKIFAFEPIPHTFDYLKKHLELNGIGNAEIFNIGLSNEIGEKDFFWTTEETGSSSMANIRERENIELVRCRLNTLDNFMSEREESIDFMKIDVEGAELFVIQGALSSISKFKPIIFSELLRKWSAKFSYHPNDVISLLKNEGYAVFVACDGKLRKIESITDDTVETNFFFLHGDKHLELINKLAF